MKLPDKLGSINLERLGEAQKLHQIEPPLTALYFRNVRLLPAKQLGELDLGKPSITGAPIADVLGTST